MKLHAIAFLAAFLAAASARAQQRTPLLRETEVAALANELSGETARRNLEGLARLHRQRGSAGFHAAAELVAGGGGGFGFEGGGVLWRFCSFRRTGRFSTERRGRGRGGTRRWAS